MRYEISDLLTELESKNAEIERLTKERDLALANADAVYARLMPEVERLRMEITKLRNGSLIDGKIKGPLWYQLDKILNQQRDADYETGSFRCGQGADYIERLRAIESAAKDVITAVSATGDYTQWFKSLGALMTVLSVNQQKQD